MAPAAAALGALLLPPSREAGGGGGASDGVGGGGEGDAAPPPPHSSSSSSVFQLADPCVPLVANATAQLERTGPRAAEALVAGVCAPVRWLECMLAAAQLAAAAGEGPNADAAEAASLPPVLFLELGCGSALTGMVRQIAVAAAAGGLPGWRPPVEARAVSTAEDVASFMRDLEAGRLS
jgi:hypothetical protein